MDSPTSDRFKRLVSLEEIQRHLKEGIKRAEEEASRTAEHYIESILERIGDRYDSYPKFPDFERQEEFSQKMAEMDPFYQIPFIADDLLKFPKDFDEAQVDRSFELPHVDMSKISKCHLVGISKSELSGHPLTPEELHEGYPHWPPLKYAWAQPNKGRLELVSLISKLVPGKHVVGSYSYNMSSANLAAAYPITSSQPRNVTVKAQPWYSGFMAHGSGNSWNDVSGYSVTITLAATALFAGSADINTVVPGSSFGVVLGWPYGGKAQYWPALSVKLATTSYDLLLITLTLSATTLQKTGSYGFALVDIDGMTSPPGKSHYFGTGGLALLGFEVEACLL